MFRRTVALAALLCAPVAASPDGVLQVPSDEHNTSQNETAEIFPWSSMRPMANSLGTYANLQFQHGLAASPDLEVGHVWLEIPSGWNPMSNGVFSSAQFYVEATRVAGKQMGGYLGSQAKLGMWGKETRQFVFSLWDADSWHKVSWVGPHCSRFGGEGTGAHCILEVDIVQGVEYKFKIAMVGSSASGAYLKGTVTDTRTGRIHDVGTLVVPHYRGLVGFGNFLVLSRYFLEYWWGGPCSLSVTSKVGLIGPYFHGGTVGPIQATAGYQHFTCPQQNVVGNVPRYGSGRGFLTMSAGRGVSHYNANGAHLWPGDLIANATNDTIIV